MQAEKEEGVFDTRLLLDNLPILPVHEQVILPSNARSSRTTVSTHPLQSRSSMGGSSSSTRTTPAPRPIPATTNPPTRITKEKLPARPGSALPRPTASSEAAQLRPRSAQLGSRTPAEKKPISANKPAATQPRASAAPPLPQKHSVASLPPKRAPTASSTAKPTNNAKPAPGVSKSQTPVTRQSSLGLSKSGLRSSTAMSLPSTGVALQRAGVAAWRSLPEEILMTVMGFCSGQTLCVFALTCKRFAELALTHDVWCVIYTQRFGGEGTPKGEIDWRKEYLDASQRELVFLLNRLRALGDVPRPPRARGGAPPAAVAAVGAAAPAINNWPPPTFTEKMKMFTKFLKVVQWEFKIDKKRIVIHGGGGQSIQSGKFLKFFGNSISFGVNLPSKGWPKLNGYSVVQIVGHLPGGGSVVLASEQSFDTAKEKFQMVSSAGGLFDLYQSPSGMTFGHFTGSDPCRDLPAFILFNAHFSHVLSELRIPLLPLTRLSGGRSSLCHIRAFECAITLRSCDKVFWNKTFVQENPSYREAVVSSMPQRRETEVVVDLVAQTFDAVSFKGTPHVAWKTEALDFKSAELLIVDFSVKNADSENLVWCFSRPIRVIPVSDGGPSRMSKFHVEHVDDLGKLVLCFDKESTRATSVMHILFHLFVK